MPAATESTVTPSNTTPAFLTVREAASIYRVNVKTLCAAIEAGSIKTVHFGRTIRISRDQIAALGAQ